MKRGGSRWDAVIIGGGIAGLSASIYLGRMQRRTLVIDAGRSMARWEPKVENYLGLPNNSSGSTLLRRGRVQAKAHHVRFVEDEVRKVFRRRKDFLIVGKENRYRARFLLLSTGIFHLPPKIKGVRTCLGHSMFFCKDCDGARVKGLRVAIYGANNEAADYALGMLAYSRRVSIVTDGKKPLWNKVRAQVLRREKIPVFERTILNTVCSDCQLKTLQFEGKEELPIDALFTTRGDVYFNELAKMLGAKTDGGAIRVDECMKTNVPRLYAAGCVTPANCQMVIAAGQGAIAAQAINRALFEERFFARP